MKARFVCMSCGQDYPIVCEATNVTQRKHRMCKGCATKAAYRAGRSEEARQAVYKIAEIHHRDLPRRTA